MTITNPAQKPALLRSMEQDFGTTIAASLWAKIVSHLNWFEQNVPVGIVMYFHGAQRYADGSPGTLIQQPLSGLWQFMDGSSVSNSESPLDGVSLPDLRQQFSKHSTTIGTTGGAPTVSLSHDHYGYTGETNDRSDYSYRRSDDDDYEVRHGGPHQHTVASDLTSSFNKLPQYQEVQAFIRISGSLVTPPGLPTDGLFQGVDDENTEFGKLVSKELAEALATTIEYLQNSIPIGMIVPIMTNIVGVPTPDANIWQECDGSEITNENSPLRSVGGSTRYTPDLTDRYVRCSTSLGIVGNNWGSNTHSGFGHNHTGWTGYHNAPVLADTVTDDWNTLIRHRHAIGTGLSGTYNMEPPYYTLKYFMRIQ